MATRIEAYVDTSAFIAFVDKSDSHHALFRRLFMNPPRLRTSVLVISEGHGWFLKRYDRNRALYFLTMIDSMDFLKVLPAAKPDLDAAGNLLRKYSDQNLTLVDALGLRLMDQSSVTSCWSTDFHLGLTGVPLVIHQH